MRWFTRLATVKAADLKPWQNWLLYLCGILLMIAAFFLIGGFFWFVDRYLFRL